MFEDSSGNRVEDIAASRSRDLGCASVCSPNGKEIMSGIEGNKEQAQMDVDATEESAKSMPSSQDEEAAIKKKYGGIKPKKPPLISKDHERAYFDSADWALGKQGVEKPKGPLEALRPKLQPTQQQTRYRKSPCAPSGEEGGTPSEDATSNE
ncbi:cAMP-regulated phosphoprotein-like protein [Quillaja saponaria]|uniref:cAMP-regulated phosphoprotein-like protein n=1 Tax=Quillaja saponaria TaxID=32244 RepID=A0AAD7VMX8_QUISA|nr:cAMP-regulated phosphoprotein-like protein [Quillaja saponaria]